MYKAGDKFTNNFDKDIWTIERDKRVLDEQGLTFEPGYSARSELLGESFDISAETLADGLHDKKLFLES